MAAFTTHPGIHVGQTMCPIFYIWTAMAQKILLTIPLWWFGGQIDMTFHPGDHVIAAAHGYADVQFGDTGRVLYTFDPDLVAVEWDRCVGGHTADINDPRGVGGKLVYCTYEAEKILEPLSEAHESVLSFGSELEELI